MHSKINQDNASVGCICRRPVQVRVVWNGNRLFGPIPNWTLGPFGPIALFDRSFRPDFRGGSSAHFIL